MTRGPAPVIWKDSALPVAQSRGQVMVFAYDVHNCADFVITGSGTLAVVRVRKVRCLHCPPATIAAELHDEIGMLRTLPGGPVSRELWVYSRYGVLRFFRVGETGLVEIGADGKVPGVPPAGPVPGGVVPVTAVPGVAGVPAVPGGGVTE